MRFKPGAILTAGLPLSIPDARIARVGGSGSTDLNTSEVLHAVAQTVGSIDRGAPTRMSIASPILFRSVAPPDED